MGLKGGFQGILSTLTSARHDKSSKEEERLIRSSQHSSPFCFLSGRRIREMEKNTSPPKTISWESRNFLRATKKIFDVGSSYELGWGGWPDSLLCMLFRPKGKRVF